MKNLRPPQSNYEEVLKETEVAERLDVERGLLSKWRQERQLPYVPLSEGPRPRIRYLWPDVSAWMLAQQLAPGQSPAEPDQRARAPEIEFINEAECARRIRVSRETLSSWRARRGMPFVPLGDGEVPRIRYAWSHVYAWLRAHSRNLDLTPAPRRRGRPRNVDRPTNRDDGRSA